MDAFSQDLTALILAGGQSRRFGSEKADFVFQGKRMLDHVAEVVSALTREILVGVGSNVGLKMPLEVAAKAIQDKVKEAGPLAGLHAGMLSCQTPWLLVVACDMPFLTVETLQQLLVRRSPATDALVARTPDGRVHPLCGCYQTRNLPLVTESLAKGDLALQVLLDKLPQVVYVDLPFEPLRNINHLADLAELKNTSS